MSDLKALLHLADTAAAAAGEALLANRVQWGVIEAEHEATQGVDHEQLHEVVESEPEESVDIRADEPAHGAGCNTAPRAARSA